MKKKTKMFNPDRADSKLDSRYGAIGISAVAAALHFKSEVKSPVNAPASNQPNDERLPDMAA